MLYVISRILDYQQNAQSNNDNILLQIICKNKKQQKKK